MSTSTKSGAINDFLRPFALLLGAASRLLTVIPLSDDSLCAVCSFPALRRPDTHGGSPANHRCLGPRKKK